MSVMALRASDLLFVQFFLFRSGFALSFSVSHAFRRWAGFVRANSLREREEEGARGGGDTRGLDLMRTGDTASYLLHDFLFVFFFASLLQLLTASCLFLLLLRVCIFSSVFLCCVCVEIIIYNFI